MTLTGPSGAGKSSLLALLLRFAEPDQRPDRGRRHGPGRASPLGAWRRQIAWVPQDPHLFAASVAENIALGDPARQPRGYRPAARAAGADGFIEDLPQGYDTAVGERGLRLSSGQRQQIALARAFLRDAPLLLLDEPAAHLDADTAARLDAALAALAPGRTVIRVSHGQQPDRGRMFTLDHGRRVGEHGLARARPSAGRCWHDRA